MAVESIVYRAADFGTPLRVEASRRAGRFHRAFETPTQYACFHPLGPWAEVIRGQELDAADARELRMRTWALRVDVEGFVEIGFPEARDFGIDPDALVADDYGACQELADRQRATGVRGMIVPSAALPGTRNLVLFGERVAAGYLDTPIDASLDVPSSMTADRGAAPMSLHPLIRRRGVGHPELEAWQAGRTFEFHEPDWAFPGVPVD